MLRCILLYLIDILIYLIDILIDTFPLKAWIIFYNLQYLQFFRIFLCKYLITVWKLVAAKKIMRKYKRNENNCLQTEGTERRSEACEKRDVIAVCDSRGNRLRDPGPLHISSVRDVNKFWIHLHLIPPFRFIFPYHFLRIWLWVVFNPTLVCRLYIST